MPSSFIYFLFDVLDFDISEGLPLHKTGHDEGHVCIQSHLKDPPDAWEFSGELQPVTQRFAKVTKPGTVFCFVNIPLWTRVVRIFLVQYARVDSQATRRAIKVYNKIVNEVNAHSITQPIY